jgi:3-deoxy-D-manno-octulosonic-acid transferase
MTFWYSLFTRAAKIITPFVARSTKTKAFVRGRVDIWEQLKTVNGKKVVWMHCASLGEYEQGLPVLEKLKKTHPSYFFLVTFFSPSGYEARKNHEVANLITYLPWDTKKDVKRFISIVNPKIVLFIKYEFWPNMIGEIQIREIPIFLISGLFRKNQIFFKTWGKNYCKLLYNFSHFFVQNKSSLELLNKIGISQVSISGDTRFDRALHSKKPLAFMDDFTSDRKCIIAGSTWPEDYDILLKAINQTADNCCWIIAPHEINEEKLIKLMTKLPENSVRYTNKAGIELSKQKVIVLDTIGILNNCYAYASLSYVGGGMGKSGLHNILEPAVEGVPIIIGKNYKKFPEAIDLIHLGGAIAVNSSIEFYKTFNELIDNDKIRAEKGNLNRRYISDNKGAADIICKQLHTFFSLN